MKKAPDGNKTDKPMEYQKPVMKTVVTPQEIRDVEQPCAFYGCGLERKKKR